MKTAKPAVRKGALSATAIFVIVSVVFTFLSIEVGSNMVVGAFQDAAEDSDREWVETNIVNKARSVCDNGGEDTIVPKNSNLTRAIPQAEEIDIENDYQTRYLQVLRGSTAFIDIQFERGSCGGPYACTWQCDQPGFNGSYDSLNPSKPIKVRIFGGSLAEGSDDVTIQVRQ